MLCNGLIGRSNINRQISDEMYLLYTVICTLSQEYCSANIVPKITFQSIYCKKQEDSPTPDRIVFLLFQLFFLCTLSLSHAIPLQQQMASVDDFQNLIQGLSFLRRDRFIAVSQTQHIGNAELVQIDQTFFRQVLFNIGFVETFDRTAVDSQ